MLRTPRALVAVTLLVVALGGCVTGDDTDGTEPGPDTEPASGFSDIDALWGGLDRMTIVDVHAEIGYEADVMCSGGGGPQVDRTGEPVLPGTDLLQVEVHADATMLPSFQVGYVIDPEAAFDETQQEDITWLDPVAAGETATYEVPVPAEGIEAPGAEHVWAFYHRLTPDGDTCYTGAGTGQWDVVVEAVRST